MKTCNIFFYYWHRYIQAGSAFMRKKLQVKEYTSNVTLTNQCLLNKSWIYTYRSKKVSTQIKEKKTTKNPPKCGELIGFYTSYDVFAANLEKRSTCSSTGSCKDLYTASLEVTTSLQISSVFFNCKKIILFTLNCKTERLVPFLTLKSRILNITIELTKL